MLDVNYQSCCPNEKRSKCRNARTHVIPRFSRVRTSRFSPKNKKAPLELFNWRKQYRAQCFSKGNKTLRSTKTLFSGGAVT